MSRANFKNNVCRCQILWEARPSVERLSLVVEFTWYNTFMMSFVTGSFKQFIIIIKGKTDFQTDQILKIGEVAKFRNKQNFFVFELIECDLKGNFRLTVYDVLKKLLTRPILVGIFYLNIKI